MYVEQTKPRNMSRSQLITVFPLVALHDRCSLEDRIWTLRTVTLTYSDMSYIFTIVSRTRASRLPQAHTVPCF